MPEDQVVPPSIVRHFATQGADPRGLATRDPAFRDMCEEFAEAETALSQIEWQSADVRGERLEECQGWIEGLLAEMEEALSASKIIPLPPRRPRRRP